MSCVIKSTIPVHHYTDIQINQCIIAAVAMHRGVTKLKLKLKTYF